MALLSESKAQRVYEYLWRLPSDLDQIPGLQSQIVDLLSRCGFSERDMFAVRLALEEAVANAMKHGNRLLPHKCVEVALGLGEDSVWIRVCDEGEGFDPDQVPDPTAEENLERPSGRGILLMRHFMDHVEYRDRGRTVFMVRRRACSSESNHQAFCAPPVAE
ncbi:MAG: ATP-binding protein [Gemmatales bacterium]|nr:ATP-binding protein [Gemmatales bacterium]MCS7161121.1 ATP-binding protein [Gemmatales bacterium]MDW8176324.1 ATP-binding protein [Gemmatales bacterium]MDW8223732.1 ATP-binding protein [Gemmatales bacterium]